MLELSKKYLKLKEKDFLLKDVKKLQDLIKYHSDLYYNKGKPIISDYEYDLLFKKLQNLEEKFEIKNKEALKVGSEVKESTFLKVAHSRPMISLDNTYNEKELRDFDERVGRQLKVESKKPPIPNPFPPREKGETKILPPERGELEGGKLGTINYCLEYKFDGLGIELIYKNGKFVQAITRGNGIEGEDITQNVLQIGNIPKKIDYSDDLEVRGEVVLPISEFERINKENLESGEKLFSNPRNAASGSLRTKDVGITKSRGLKFFAYDLANFGDFIEKISKKSISQSFLLQKKRKIKNNYCHSELDSESFLELNFNQLKDPESSSGGQQSFHKEQLGLKESENITYYQIIKTLEKLGFEISSYFKVFRNIDEIISEIQNFGDYKKDIDFDVDGLVLKVNNIDLWEKIGWTEHHPRYAIAYKFPAEIFTTKILSVDTQVGRTGTITPVANLESVNISGVNVKRATLHNYEEVEKLGVKIGDYVFIKRAGEVIPKIVSVAQSREENPPIPSSFSQGKKGKQISSQSSPEQASSQSSPEQTSSQPSLLEDRELEQKVPMFTKNETILPPKFCPSCGAEVKKDEDKVRYYCPNFSSCPAQNSEKLIFAVGKNAFNIDGLGKNQIKLFLEIGLIHNLLDIFKLSLKKDEILALEGFREKSVNNLLESLENAKNVSIINFLVALGISGVGKKTAKNISKLFSSKDDILDFSYSLEDLENIEDIGPEIAKNIYGYFNDENNKNLLKELLEILNIDYFKENKALKGGFFVGKKVCVTGSFEKDGKKIKRDDLIEILEKNSGEFVSSVSKNTDFLLAGEKSGSKLKKAESLGVEVLSLGEFMERIKK